MKLQIENITLVGTTRKVPFAPGLNIIVGPISTGKTSLLRLCRILLGRAIGSLPEEVKLIYGVAGRVGLQTGEYDVYRPLNTSNTAKVEIAGPGNQTERLPVLVPDETSATTYGSWLLHQLGLKVIEAPSAPTRPDSDFVPVSINDYLNYCDLPKEEIRTDVFGHKHPQKDVKRKYVFGILYGQYSADIAILQQQLRDVRSKLSVLAHDTDSFERLLQGTRWSNRAEMDRELSEAKVRLKEIETQIISLADGSPGGEQARELRVRIQNLDQEIADLRVKVNREKDSIKNLEQLATQLENQHARLTRSLVANEQLLDIDFIVCPRCGSSIESIRSDSTHCYLCLQEPRPTYTRKDLLQEQNRVALQTQETRELIEYRNRGEKTLAGIIAEKLLERTKLSEELDFLTASYVSDISAKIESLSSGRASLIAKIEQIEDYLKLYQNQDIITSSLEKYRRGEKRLQAELDVSTTRSSEVEDKIRLLEQEFTEILGKFKLPEFLGTAQAQINRRTYMPTVNLRDFESLMSEGLSVEVNVAHALAHQRMALKHKIPLPNILFIDGISGAFGTKGYDPQRTEAIYQYLINVSDEFTDQLQIIVADNRIPPFAQEFVKLELKEDDRLISDADIKKLQEEQNK
jgi:hypothetical protein